MEDMEWKTTRKILRIHYDDASKFIISEFISLKCTMMMLAFRFCENNEYLKRQYNLDYPFRVEATTDDNGSLKLRRMC